MVVDRRTDELLGRVPKLLPTAEPMIADSALEGRVYCELVSGKGNPRRLAKGQDSEGFGMITEA